LFILSIPGFFRKFNALSARLDFSGVCLNLPLNVLF
jgi:hypothetical protein